MITLTTRSMRSNSDYRAITRTLLDDSGLPAAIFLPAVEIERIFRHHDALFGTSYNAIYNTAIVLWAFISQILADGKMRSCATAVERIACYLTSLGRRVPSTDTGDYCLARQKLNENALRELAREAAEKIETVTPDDWLWYGRHVKLIDGFTATMPDTPENQAEFPQSKTQKPGVGFPILRACVLISLATACVLDAAIGRYSGKETGESALLREMLDTFDAGDVALFDRYFGSYMMLALLMRRRVDVCTRMHQLREIDFRRGRRLGKYDRLVVWQRPARPPWMDTAMYETIPSAMTLRMIRFMIHENGCRAKSITVITTLTDPNKYSAEQIAELYGYRWCVELDIRDVKQTLNLDHMRCKTPAMIRREFWTTLLAFNMIRRAICRAASEHGGQPRQISFTRTCVIFLTWWQQLASEDVDTSIVERLLARIAKFIVPDRPGRIEPRELKRRRHTYKLMQRPREERKKELMRKTNCRTIT